MMDPSKIGGISMTEAQQKILDAVSRFSRAAMAQNDPAHDSAHVERVVRLTQNLSARCGADAYRAQLLAWLHDLNDDKLASDLGTASIEGFLREIGAEKSDIDFVLQGIPYISYRKYPKLTPDIPLEIRLVQDADRLDAMGAIGIARTFAYGGARGRSLEESLAHFDEKLLRLYDLLSTDAARELAAQRRDLLRQFYDQFKEEM
jgi:uncharacterized protein